TRAATSPPGNSPTCSPPRCGRRSGRCANQTPTGGPPATRRPHPAGPGRGLAGTSSHRKGHVMTAFWRTPAGLHFASAQLPDEGELASFDGATGWLNSEPLTPAGLRGKVVLVDF